MNLTEYISEAIRSGKNRLYKFPLTIDKQDTIDWLEYKGFKEVDNKHKLTDPMTGELKELTNNGQDMIYIVGAFRYNNPGTHWIQFGTLDVLFTIVFDEDPRFNNNGLIYTQFSVKRDSFLKRTNFKDIEEFAREVEKEFC